MNTPLHNAARKAWDDAHGEYVSRYWSKPALDMLTADEFAAAILKPLAPFVLDWRRVEDDMPDGDTTVFVAIEDDPEIWIGYLGDEQIWRNQEALPLTGRVYAWSPLPAAPRPEQLIGFAPRPHVPAATPAPHAG